MRLWIIFNVNFSVGEQVEYVFFLHIARTQLVIRIDEEAFILLKTIYEIPDTIYSCILYNTQYFEHIQRGCWPSLTRTMFFWKRENVKEFVRDVFWTLTCPKFNIGANFLKIAVPMCVIHTVNRNLVLDRIPGARLNLSGIMEPGKRHMSGARK